MSDDNFDDGLVHCHQHLGAPVVATRPAKQVADAASVPTPSTARNDDLIELSS